jgi:predicted Zn-ribbon and HTH transcriptional regulator
MSDQGKSKGKRPGPPGSAGRKPSGGSGSMKRKPPASSGSFTSDKPPSKKSSLGSSPKPVSKPSVRPAPRVSAGAGLSEEMVERLGALDDKLDALRDAVTMSDPQHEVDRIDDDITQLAEQVIRVRERGYRYKSYLERKVKTLQDKWRQAEPVVRRELRNAESELVPAYDNLAQQRGGIERRGASQLTSFEREVDDLQARVSTADAKIESAYSGVRSTLQQTQQQVREVDWLLDQIEQASFDLLAGENPIQAVEAKWWRDGKKQGPEGILYLTDQRLLFEQKEQVATKKVLFVATEKETIQELLIEAPVGAVSTVTTADRGIGGHQDHIEVEFREGDYAGAHFHLHGQESEMWVSLIKRVLNGEIEREKYYAEGEDAAAEQATLDEALASAPSSCPSCGAPFDAQLVKGQRQLECEYCGMVARW